MDCRRTLGLGVCLLIGAVGCTRHDTTLPVIPPAQASANRGASAPGATAVSVDAVPPGAVVKDKELPKREPKPATCVAGGDCLALEAASADVPEDLRQAKREQARKAYEQAITLDPHCVQAYLSLAQLYVTMKDHTDAEATYRKAAQLCPNDARVFFEMGRCYGAQKKWDLAVQSVGHAVELDPKTRPYVDELGWMQARSGRFDDSLATFRRVYDEAEAQYKLARMLYQLGQDDQCRQHLQIALTRDPQIDKRGLLAQLDAPPSAQGVRPAAFVTADKPQTAAVITAVATDKGPAVAPSAARRVMLPPPPRIPIRYEEPAAQVLPPLPALPGADLK